MQMQYLGVRAIAFVAGIAALSFSGWASADPPSRIARLGYTSGAVSFSPAGENDWVLATVNRPLTTGDRLWADASARAEIQVGGAMIRMGGDTGVSILNLDDNIAQLQLSQGTLNIRVRRLGLDQVFEIDTPNLAFTMRQPGEYRISVDPDGTATDVVVRRGQGDVYGEGAAYLVDSHQAYRFMGTGLREYLYIATPGLDEFDRWARDRDRGYDTSISARYVSQDVVGYQDLDANGTWRADATYGNVWFPTRVVAGWAPYRYGHWAWIDPWGWTWVDDAPWGFAVSHYGRWTSFGGTWGWVPGPPRTRAYYAPALVAFVGGNNFRLTISSGSVGGIAWFPLGPREVYRPPYVVSRGYFENVNRSNTVVNNTVINNYYNNTNVTNVVYANRQVPGAVVAVPTTAFVQSQPVSQAAVQVSRDMFANAPIAAVPAVVPTERSVRGAAARGDAPPTRVFERPVVAHTAPPPAHVGFAAQQQQLAAQPGQPLDAAARRGLKPATVAPAPVVKVVAPTAAAQPNVVPQTAAPAGRPADGRRTPDERRSPTAPAVSGAPVAPAPGATQPRTIAPQAAPPAPALQPQEPREQRGKREPRGQPVAPPPAAPQGATQPSAPQAAPPAQALQPQESRGRRDTRGQPVAPPPAAPQGAVQPQTIAPQAAPPTPASARLPPQRPVAPKVTPPPQVPPVPAVQQPAQPKPDASRAKDKKKDSDEQKRDDEEARKKKS